MSWWKSIKRLNKKVLGINERNLRLVYPLNPRKHFHLADDKVATKAILSERGIPVPQQLMVIERIGEIEEKWAEFPAQACAIKPARGRGGGGILVLSHENGQWIKGDKVFSDLEIKRHIANIIFGVYGFGADDVALIEEKINPHSCFTDLYAQGVADVRVIIKEGEILMAMLRVPTAESDGRANLHQGALGVGIDLNTGKLTSAYDGSEFLTEHPDSGVKFEGVSIPFWEDVIRITHEVNDALPLDYLGIDFAFDQQKGPQVLEVNVRPGLEIQNVNQEGLRPKIES